MDKQKVDLSKYDNSWYSTKASPLKRVLWYYCSLIFVKNHWNPLSSLKVFILKIFGAKIGSNVRIKPGVNIKYPWLLTIGNNAWIGEDVWIDNLTEVVVGNNACISQGALLLTGNHNYKLETFDLITGKIILEDGVWIGAKALVCGGVSCGSHAVLTAGSVAATDLEAYQIYKGNPAIKYKERTIQ